MRDVEEVAQGSDELESDLGQTACGFEEWVDGTACLAGEFLTAVEPSGVLARALGVMESGLTAEEGREGGDEGWLV